MVKKWNERITITLPKTQLKWLKNTAKSEHITVSVLIKKILSSSVYNHYKYLNDGMSEEEMKEAIRIAKTPWLDED